MGDMDDRRTLRKRVYEPARYEITCDLCGGANITWSEYEHLIWCYDCENDTAGQGGIFDWGLWSYSGCRLIWLI